MREGSGLQQERLNADLKHVVGRKVPVRTKAKLRAAAEQHMVVISGKPAVSKPAFGTHVSSTQLEIFQDRIKKH